MACREGVYSGGGHIHGLGCRHHTDNPQQGNNDLLILTKPGAIEDLHFQVTMAGADSLDTKTVSGTTIAQVACRAADHAQATDGKRRFVTGAKGPTNRTASISSAVTDPGFPRERCPHDPLSAPVRSGTLCPDA